MKHRTVVACLSVLLLLSAPGVADATSQGSTCGEPIPLFPGYPGYRGNVPGLAGAGDYACLNDLEDLDPDFSPRQEDGRNREVADDLEIDGDIEDWTWETWMAIEAERGLGASCYACLLQDPYLQPTDPSVQPDTEDPRILAGSFTTPIAIPYLAARLDLPQLSNMYFHDYQLRVTAYLDTSIPYPTAPQLLDLYDEIAPAAFVPMGEGGWAPAPDEIIRVTLERGGYVAAPDSIHMEDQIFLIHVGFLAAESYLMPMVADPMESRYQQAETEWRAAHATDGPDSDLTFAEFMRREFKDLL